MDIKGDESSNDGPNQLGELPTNQLSQFVQVLVLPWRRGGQTDLFQCLPIPYLETPLFCLFNPLQDGSLTNQTLSEISAPHDLGDCQHNLSVCVCVCECVCVYVCVCVCECV